MKCNDHFNGTRDDFQIPHINILTSPSCLFLSLTVSVCRGPVEKEKRKMTHFPRSYRAKILHIDLCHLIMHCIIF